MTAILKKQSTGQKAQVLGADSKYDTTGIPCKETGFIYPSVGLKGECIPLFKVLQTNYCIHNCNYCCNRKDRNCVRAGFQPEELANLFMNYYKRSWVKGFFLTSAIYPSPDKAQERMLATIEILRNQYRYEGYIHAVVLPGADFSFIEALGRYSDRLSLNLEVPKARFLRKLAPTKDFQGQLWEGLGRIARFNMTKKLSAGVTTQLVVGASDETDEEILDLSWDLYRNYKLTRVYYSGFSPIYDTPLSGTAPCPTMREARLYQADFLLRRYGFKINEMVFGNDGNLDLDRDPKLMWAERHPEFFPIEVTTASYEQLIRVPGIGTISAKRILDKRGNISSLEQLRKLGVVTKRAQGFIAIRGKQFVRGAVQEIRIPKQLFLWEEL